LEGYFVHPHALCESDTIGERTRIWAFAHVMKGARIGEDCNIGDHAFVESGVVIGDRVTVKNGVAIWDGVEIDDDVFLGPNCVLTNDLMPRSRVYHDENIRTYIRRGASIGANATIVAGNTLGEYCMVGAGAVVTHDVPPFAIVAGTPARRIGWAGIKGDRLDFDGRDDVELSEGRYSIAGDVVSFSPATPA
jgi:acetyltransferase-like isoleucine patch superfamily enzyme